MLLPGASDSLCLAPNVEDVWCTSLEAAWFLTDDVLVRIVHVEAVLLVIVEVDPMHPHLGFVDANVLRPPTRGNASAAPAVGIPSRARATVIHTNIPCGRPIEQVKGCIMIGAGALITSPQCRDRTCRDLAETVRVWQIILPGCEFVSLVGDGGCIGGERAQKKAQDDGSLDKHFGWERCRWVRSAVNQM